MKSLLQKSYTHRVVGSFFLASAVFVLAGFGWAFFSLRSVGANVPLILHFNDIDGITNSGGIGQVVGMGIFGLLVVFMNFSIALEFEERRPFLGKFLSAMTFVFTALLFLAFAAIISVNI